MVWLYMGVYTLYVLSFVVKLKFLYMNYFCAIELQRLYIYDRITKKFVLKCYPPFVSYPL